MNRIFLFSSNLADYLDSVFGTIQKQSLLIIFFAISLMLTSCTLSKTDHTQEQATVDYDLLLTLPDEPISYHRSVKPVLERRCIVCHGCFDAPCQLKLSSYEGIKRGASKQLVYDGSRVFGAEPTRLMIDAKTTAEWHDKGFHPVLNEGETTPKQNLDQSVFYQMLRLKQLHPQARIGMLPDDFDLALNRKQICPKRDEFEDYVEKYPLWGMPYAMPNLSDREYSTLVQWLAQGSPAPPLPEPTKEAALQIEQWERFLNGDSNKEKLVSRYIYEHLFQAHIHFLGTPAREFFRLVRSTTPSGQTINEIPTIHPYDDPETLFYYRILPYHASIVAKDHVVYELSSQKMTRYRQLFLEPDYEVVNLPTYESNIASNPFKVYEAIPPNSRYRFLLDDARFFIEGFIKGPVCRGQIALNVIEDQFWIFFFNPDYYIKTNDADFLNNFSNSLDIPSEQGDTLNIFAAWTQYWDKLSDYKNAKQESFLDQSQQIALEQAMDSIWHGDGNNPNAALTVFRHFDSASVSFGLVGDYPETAWIIDYPLLERIHYLLVAGFNVYGNVGHQLNTRLYMDFLRMEGENHFLAYLPVSKRKEIRDSWYAGMRANLEKYLHAPDKWLEMEVVVGYQTDNPQTELYQHIEHRLGTMAGPLDHLNRCQSQPCLPLTTNSTELQSDTAMTKVADIKGNILRVFPDTTFVRVRTDGKTERDLAYTLIRNKAYKNLSSMFANEDNRNRENDTISVVKGLHGAYPNFFFDVELSQVDDFAERYAAIRNRKDYERFVGLFGVRRTRADFWDVADWFQDYYAEQQPVLSGLFDLNRYHNR